MSEPENRAAEPQPAGDRIALHGDDPAIRRKRLVGGLVAISLLASAVGGIVGLFTGQEGGLIAAAIVGLPLLYLLLHNTRRRIWLADSELVVRTWGVRRIDLVAVERIDLLITEVRSARTVALMVSPAHGAGVKIDLAIYAGTRGRELDILALRKLANALVNNTAANGMVFSELLVAQLRSEAKGDPAEARPLHRLAAAAPSGKLAQRYPMQAVSKFVASLE